MGREGGGIDLNLGTPEPVRSAIRSDKLLLLLPSPLGRFSSSLELEEEEAVMTGLLRRAGKLKKLADAGGGERELAEVSELPEKEAIN